MGAPKEGEVMIVNPTCKLWRCAVEYINAHGQTCTLWSSLLNRSEAKEKARHYQNAGFIANAILDEQEAASFVDDEREPTWSEAI